MAPSSFVASDAKVLPPRIIGGRSLPTAPDAGNLLAWWNIGSGVTVDGTSKVVSWRAAQGIDAGVAALAAAGGPTFSAAGAVFTNLVAERLQVAAGLTAWATGAIVAARFRLAAFAPAPNHGLGLAIDAAGSYVYALVNGSQNFAAESRGGAGIVRSAAIGPAPVSTWCTIAAYGGAPTPGTHDRRVNAWDGAAQRPNFGSTTTPTAFSFASPSFQIGAAGGLSSPCCPWNGTISDVMLYRAPGATPTQAALQAISDFLRDLWP